MNETKYGVSRTWWLVAATEWLPVPREGGTDMGLTDKAKNTTQRASGEVKETVGKHTDNPDLEAEGKKDQTAGELKNAGEQVKDAGRKARDAVTD